MAIKNLANNRRARHDYELEDRFEAGLVLTGTEVKSLRQGKVSIQEAYCAIRQGEAYIYEMHIAPFEQGNINNVDSKRTRKLLLHRREIDRLLGQTRERGYSLIPTRVYLKNQFVKVEIALARGKNVRDKRQALIRKDQERQMARAMKEYGR